MDYTFTPTLQHRTLAKIAICLWNKGDTNTPSEFLFLPATLDSEGRKTAMKSMRDDVLKQVSKLPLPQLFKKELSRFVEVVSRQTLTWAEFLHKYEIDVPSKVWWASDATIDKKKTAEVLVRDQNLSFNNRYILSCIFCLEKDINFMYRQAGGPRGLPYREKNKAPLVPFWCSYMTGELSQLSRTFGSLQLHGGLNDMLFKHSAHVGNEVATKFFFQKLTPCERNKNVVSFAVYVAKVHGTDSDTMLFSKECYTEILYFFLSNMDENQQQEVFRNHPSGVLGCFLEWPWQSTFVEIAKKMESVLSAEDYLCLLKKIAQKTINGYKDYDYQKLFREFWKQSPTGYKTYIINGHVHGLLSVLFATEDEENIMLILENATSEEKRSIISCEEGLRICGNLIVGGNDKQARFLIRNCIPFEYLFEFKEGLDKTKLSLGLKEELVDEEGGRPLWVRFSQIIEDLIQENDKKRSLEGGNILTKRLCTNEFEEAKSCTKNKQKIFD